MRMMHDAGGAAHDAAGQRHARLPVHLCPPWAPLGDGVRAHCLGPIVIRSARTVSTLSGIDIPTVRMCFAVAGARLTPPLSGTFRSGAAIRLGRMTYGSKKKALHWLVCGVLAI